MLPICTKLLSGEGSPDDLGGDIVTMTLRNPDGPEAADIIEALYEALEILLTKGAMMGHEKAKAALALARGEHP